MIGATGNGGCSVGFRRRKKMRAAREMRARARRGNPIALTLGLPGGKEAAPDLTRGRGEGVGRRVRRREEVKVLEDVDWKEGMVLKEAEEERRSDASLLVGRGSMGAPNGSVVSSRGEAEVFIASSVSVRGGKSSAGSSGAGSSGVEGSAPAAMDAAKKGQLRSTQTLASALL